jgi:hypothetical protein
MTKITGRIGKEHVDAHFQDGHVHFKKNDKTFRKTDSLWFVYFQRLNKSLKTCDAVLFDGKELVEFVISQKDVDNFTDVIDCVSYRGDSDPLPWKRFLKDAKKHNWDQDDWQHLFEVESSEELSSEDDEWKPGDEGDEGDEDEEDDEDDESDEESFTRDAKRMKK